jgi:sodium-dependent dicarboxylate transporter 2/3/5
VTALLPLVLLPITGVAPAGVISAAYFSDPILLFFGSFLLAAAVEEQGLHTKVHP